MYCNLNVAITPGKSWWRILSQELLGLQFFNLIKQFLTEKTMSNNRLQFPGIGAIMGAISGALFAMSGAFGNVLMRTKHPIFASCSRFLVSSVLCILTAVFMRAKFWKYSLRDYGLMTLNNILAATADIMIYFCIATNGLTNTIALVASYPVFVAIIARICLGIKLQDMDIISTFFCFAGVIFSTQPDFLFHPQISTSFSQTIGNVLSLTASICFATSSLMMKGMTYIDATSFNLIKEVQVFMIVASGFLIVGVNPGCISSMDFVNMVACGSSSWFSSVILLLSMKIDSALMVSIGRTSDIAIAILIDFVVFDKQPNVTGLIGCILITISVVLPAAGSLLRERAIVPVNEATLFNSVPDCCRFGQSNGDFQHACAND